MFSVVAVYTKNSLKAETHQSAGSGFSWDPPTRKMTHGFYSFQKITGRKFNDEKFELFHYFCKFITLRRLFFYPFRNFE